MISAKSLKNSKKSCKTANAFFMSIRELKQTFWFYFGFMVMAIPVISEVTVWNSMKNLDKNNYNKKAVSECMNGILAGKISIIGFVVTGIFAIIFGMRLFKYLNSKNSIDFFHAIPFTRTQLFFGRFLAGISMMLVAMASAYAVLFFILQRWKNVVDFSYGTIFEPFGYMLFAAFLIFYSTVFACICAGNSSSAFFIMIITNIAYPLIYLFSSTIAEFTLSGYSARALGPSEMKRSLFSPWLGAILCGTKYQTVLGASINHIDIGKFFLWWSIFSAVIIALTVILYQKRPSEAAENSFAFKPIKYILQFIVFIIVFMFAFIISYANLNVSITIAVLFAIFFAFVAYFIMEVSCARGIKFIKPKTFFCNGLIFLAVPIILLTVLKTGFFGYKSYVPKADEISYVEYKMDNLSELPMIELQAANEKYSYENGYSESKSYLFKHEVCEAKTIEAVCNWHKNIIANLSSCNTKDCYPDVTVVYHMKNGKKVFRSYAYKNIKGYKFDRENGEITLNKKYILNDVLNDFPEYRTRNFSNALCMNIIESAGVNSDSLNFSNQKEYEKLKECIERDIFEHGYITNENSKAFDMKLEMKPFKVTKNSVWYTMYPELLGKTVKCRVCLRILPEYSNTLEYLKQKNIQI